MPTSEDDNEVEEDDRFIPVGYPGLHDILGNVHHSDRVEANIQRYYSISTLS